MKRIKLKILNWLISHLFNGVTEQDVIQVVGKNMYYKNTLLTPQQRHGIIEEAKAIKSLAIWNILLDEIKHASNKKLYLNSTTTDDMFFGKAGLWIVDILEKKIDTLSNM